MFYDEITNFTFDSAGIYEIKLIAWLYDPSCADTFFTKLYVYDHFSLSVPNIFSPNNDTKNDVFGITVSDEVEVSYEIFNRWGNEIENGVAKGKAFIEIWDGKSVTDGTYFYKLNIELKEKLMLPKTKNEDVIDESDFPIKIEGWVQVVR